MHAALPLRHLRRLAGMKQSHLADLMGVTQPTVSRWENGSLPPTVEQTQALQAIFAARPDPAQDAALKRLVETSMSPVHLICDLTHRLLAASPARAADWRVDLGDYLGRSLLVYASEEILAAEARLDDLGWRDGQLAALAFDTGANDDPDIPIRPGPMLWERVRLSDGSSGRLVTSFYDRPA
ncbi:XRE family transcriptional regulator protein [uncultured Pleomorphomonas sp.]|uniref:XRE family transcriptional regulator protein n=1 Tax=uncultured Pleomorphomonas sp. TaxID=442121 RepID=A0A212LD75_9HYPH|nr:helix-turn-helix transcriptional regulator [uncultured Pleomorphomonas sp.]SCM75485.1 XRE family transcriptional regulator protein [uncultured Pleomorphomonas sp.]